MASALILSTKLIRRSRHGYLCRSRDPRAVGTVVFVLTETEKFQRPIAATDTECMKNRRLDFVNESKLRQKFTVKLPRDFHVFHSQIDAIKATRFHLLIFDRIASQFNRW
jgi:hypothetical protein